MNACIRQRWRWRSEWRGWRMKYALSRQARWHLLPIASMDEEDRLLNLTTRRNRAYADLSITKICPRIFHFFFFFQFKQFPRSLYCRFGIRMLNLLKEQFFFWFITMIYSFKKKKKKQHSSLLFIDLTNNDRWAKLFDFYALVAAKLYIPLNLVPYFKSYSSNFTLIQVTLFLFLLLEHSIKLKVQNFSHSNFLSKSFNASFPMHIFHHFHSYRIIVFIP